MTARIQSVAILFVLASTLAHTAVAGVNLVQNGNFNDVSYNGTAPAGITTLFGQFGTGQGSNLTVANWTTTGYNFVYAPGTADSGSRSGGANVGAPNEAPSLFNSSTTGFGITYLYGPNNEAADGVSGATLPATSPLGNNFVAGDGGYIVDAISQTINGLEVNKAYELTFYWGGVEQESFSGGTTENWTVSLTDSGGNGQSFTTADVNNPITGEFSGWLQQKYVFIATAPTETLAFLAAGAPSSEPPFSLLADVSLEIVPDFSHWLLFAGFGGLAMTVEVLRRRKQQSELVLSAV